MKSMQVVAFLLVIVAGVVAIREAPLASVFAFAGAAAMMLPLWKTRSSK